MNALPAMLLALLSLILAPMSAQGGTAWATDSAAFFTATPPAAGQPYTFTQQGQRYTFTFRFVVDASPDQVLDMLYAFPNLQQYSRTASAVELLESGADWQLVRFTYATWLWSMSTSFRREIDRPNHCIRFRMVDARRTGLPVPLPMASSGEYRVDPFDGGVRVSYLQVVEARDSLLLGPWMARAHSEAIQFSHDLETYLRSRLPGSRNSIDPALVRGTGTTTRIPPA
jgi:hypothetical protein